MPIRITARSTKAQPTLPLPKPVCNTAWPEVYSDPSASNPREAERVIRTLTEMWHNQFIFKDSADRHLQLIRFINFYNTVKPHKRLKNASPYEILTAYFNQPLCKQL
jgi:hypothetical protein